MTAVEDLRRQFSDLLSASYSESEISFLWKVLFEEYCGKTLHETLTVAEWDKAEPDIIKALDRLQTGEPYQYILGHVPFYSLKLKVDPSVLIPRPETEELVDLIQKENSNQKLEAILDIGTGSGCLALSLAQSFPNSIVTAVDISINALEVAHQNAMLNDLKNLDFKHLDVLNCQAKELPCSDLIVSNPPYIIPSESAAMDAQVLEHEPDQALFVPEEDPLLFYKRIMLLANNRLNKGGAMYFELNALFARECEQLFEEAGWRVKLYEDMSGNLRFLKAEK